jgi:hypothetical protein
MGRHSLDKANAFHPNCFFAARYDALAHAISLNRSTRLCKTERLLAQRFAIGFIAPGFAITDDLNWAEIHATPTIRWFADCARHIRSGDCDVLRTGPGPNE